MKIKDTLRKKAKGKKGFTLVELVIVIAVLAIIAAIAIPTVTNVIGNANTAADKSNAQSIELAIKTAQAEVAANNTNKSDNANALINAASTDKNLGFLLKTYGVDTTSVGLGDGTSNSDTGDKLKVAGQHFYYNASSGKVIAFAPTDKIPVPTGYTILKTSAGYSITNNSLSITTS